MKLCIIVVAFSFTGLDAAFSLSRYDENLPSHGRDTDSVSQPWTRKHKNDGNQLPRISSDRTPRSMVKGRRGEPREANSEHLSEDFASLQKLGIVPPTNVDTSDKQEAQITRPQSDGDGNSQNIDFITRRRLFADFGSDVPDRATVLNSINSRLEVRGKEAKQGKATEGRLAVNSQSSSVSTSPFGTPRAQAGPSIRRSSGPSLVNRRSSSGNSGELVNGYHPGEPSQLSRENSFEHVVPTVETNENPKTSTSTKLYRGTGLGVHYIRKNPKEAGLVALSAFGQAASVGALGPLVYGSKGVGMAVAGVGALANFAAYSGQAATNVKKWQKTEAKIPEEKLGAPLDPLLDATKAFADRSSHLTRVVSKGAVKPFQIAGGQLKKAVPGSMSKVHSEPNLRGMNNERRSEEYEEIGHVQDTDTLEPRTLQQREFRTLKARKSNAMILRDDISATLSRRGTPPEKTKGSPARSPTHGSAGVSAPSPGDKSSSRNSPPKDILTSGSTSTSTTQSRDKSSSNKSPPRTVGGLQRLIPTRPSPPPPLTVGDSQPTSHSVYGPIVIPTRQAPPASRGSGRRSFDITNRPSSTSTARSRSVSPTRPGMRRTPSVLLSNTQSSLGRADSSLPSSSLDRNWPDSPRPITITQGRFRVTTEPRQPASVAGSSRRPVSPGKQHRGELQPPKPTFQTLPSIVRGSESSRSPPKLPSSEEIAELSKDFEKDWRDTQGKSSARLSSGRSFSLERSASPPKGIDSEEPHSPKSAFSEGGFESPPWAALVTPSGARNVRPASAPAQTRQQAEAELRAEERKSRSPEKRVQSAGERRSRATEGSKPTSKFERMPLMNSMRQRALPMIEKSASGSSTSSSPFGSPKYQTRPAMIVPIRDFSRDWPEDLSPPMSPTLPKTPPSSP